MGSQGIAAAIAQLAFWILLIAGIAFGELRRAAAVFVALWVVGYFGLPGLFALGALFVTPCTAVLDIVLVFLIFKQDVRLT